MPTLRTPRLELRPLRPDDARLLLVLNADRRVLEHTGDAPFRSLGEARAVIEDQLARYERDGTGRLVVELSGWAIGWAGVSRGEGGELDLGFRLLRAAWGRGVATEAGRACLDDAFERLGAERVIGRVRAENPASVRVLEKLGMVGVGEVDDDGGRWIVYEMLAQNWK